MSETVRQEVVEAARAMYSKGLVNAFEGNCSSKDGNRIYITPTATCKSLLTEDMLAVTDESGNVVEGCQARPSSEIKLHLAAYRLRPDVKAVVHTHSVFATAYAIANKPIVTDAYPEMILLFDKIPVVPYGTPSTDEIYRGMEKYIFDTDVFLIGNHGVVAVGSSAMDAFYKAESVESMAKTLTIAKFLGGEHPISEKNLELLYRRRKERRGKDRVKL